LLALNLQPGPLFIARNPDLFWGLVASMYIGNAMLLVLNLPLVGLFVRILLVPRSILVPVVVAIAYIAVYAATSSSFDLLAMTAFGVIGYLMRKLGFPLAPVILAVVLGGMMEKSFRQALSLSDGDYSTLYGSPLAIAMWILVLVSLTLPFLLARRRPATVSVVASTEESS
jgi:putative tricarboxylic transport membrane protein